MLFPFLEEIPDCPALLGMGDEAHIARDELRMRDGRIGFVETGDHDPVFGLDDCFLYKSGLRKLFFKDPASFQSFLPVLDPAFVVPGGTVGVDGIPVNAVPSVVLLNQSA